MENFILVRRNITYISKINPITKYHLKVLMRIGKNNGGLGRRGPGPLIIVK